jgi:hypothetical protein
MGRHLQALQQFDDLGRGQRAGLVEVLDLSQGVEHGGRGEGVELLFISEQRGATPVRCRHQPPHLLPQRRRRVGLRAQLIDRLQQRSQQDRARSLRVDLATRAAPHVGLELVDDLGRLDDTGMAQIRGQVGDAPLGLGQQRVADEREQCAAERGVVKRHAPRARAADAVARQRLLEALTGARQRAADHDEFVGRHSLRQRGRDRGGHQLGLGTLAPGLHQRHRRTGIEHRRVGLEQVALEVVKRHPHLVLVVVVERRQLADGLGECAQLLDDGRPGGERRAAGLVGQ